MLVPDTWGGSPKMSLFPKGSGNRFSFPDMPFHMREVRGNLGHMTSRPSHPRQHNNKEVMNIYIYIYRYIHKYIDYAWTIHANLWIIHGQFTDIRTFPNRVVSWFVGCWCFLTWKTIAFLNEKAARGNRGNRIESFSDIRGRRGPIFNLFHMRLTFCDGRWAVLGQLWWSSGVNQSSFLAWIQMVFWILL